MSIVTRSRPGILIVEDHAAVRSFLRGALRRTARVFEASDADGAIKILRDRARDGLDLVLTDYRLPTGSGLDVLRSVKQACPWIPVIIITGYGSEELAVQAFRDGASDYLIKPIRLDSLLRTVDRFLNRRRDATPARSADARGDVDSRIRDALTFLTEHFAEPITLARVATAAGLSRFHFCRLFHRDTGQPFHAYLRELRVSRAMALLADETLPVTRVAYAVGFKDISHFDKTFRAIVGQAPGQYRISLASVAGPRTGHDKPRRPPGRYPHARRTSGEPRKRSGYRSRVQ